MTPEKGLREDLKGVIDSKTKDRLFHPVVGELYEAYVHCLENMQRSNRVKPRIWQADMTARSSPFASHSSGSIQAE